MLAPLALAFVPLSLPQAVEVTTPLRGRGASRPPITLDFLAASAAGQPVVSETHLAFLVQESSTGAGVDFNGDGDLEDRIVAWYDRQADELTISALDGRSVLLGDGFAGVLRSESDSGQDLDGDGFISSNVAAVIDLESGALTNLGVRTVSLEAAGGPHLAIRAGIPLRMMVYSHVTGSLVVTDYDTIGARAGGAGVAWVAPEGFGGGGDLNGDGDSADFVAVMLLADQSTFISSETPTSGILALSQSSFYFRSVESALGSDLDGDGGLNDQVVFRKDIAGGPARALGVSYGGSFPSYVVEDGFLWMQASEGFSGDLNGDGDTDDGALLGTSLDGDAQLCPGVLAYFAGSRDGRALIHVDEESEGLDLNGDGDTIDRVGAIWDLASGNLINLASAPDGPVDGGISGGFALFTASEARNSIDQNGDGDTFDCYVEVFDATTGASRSTALPDTARIISGSDYARAVLVRVQELDVGSDLSGDGDIQDSVVYVLELADLRVTATGTATNGASYVQGDELFFVAFESDNQDDMTADGDLNDRAYVVGRLP